MAVSGPPSDTIGHAYARARFNLASQERFLACVAECGRVLDASRWAKVARSEHYRWLDEDPTYPVRFKAAEKRWLQSMKDEAVRRAHDGVLKLLLYKGKPVRHQGQLVYERIYSDHLMIKFLEAGDPDHFNRQRVAPLEGDLDNLTEGQVRDLLEWLRKGIQAAESIQMQKEAAQLPAAEVQPAEPERKK